LFGEKGPGQSAESATPPITIFEQLAALKGALEMREKSLALLREDQRMLQDENESLRKIYVERTEEVVALRKEVDRLRHQLGMAAPAINRIPGAES